MLKIMKVIEFALVVVAFSYAAGTLTPDLSLVQPYSLDLARNEPYSGQPFLSHFRNINKSIIFLAAHHENNVQSKTLWLIDRAFKDFMEINCS